MTDVNEGLYSFFVSQNASIPNPASRPTTNEAHHSDVYCISWEEAQHEADAALGPLTTITSQFANTSRSPRQGLCCVETRAVGNLSDASLVLLICKPSFLLSMGMRETKAACPRKGSATTSQAYFMSII